MRFLGRQSTEYNLKLQIHVGSVACVLSIVYPEQTVSCRTGMPFKRPQSLRRNIVRAPLDQAVLSAIRMMQT